MTESHNLATGQDSEPAAQDFLNSDIETSVSTAGTDAGQVQPPPVLKGADGPVLDHTPSREELHELAVEYARRRELSGNAPQAPTQFTAPGVGEFKDAKSAIEKGTENRLLEIYQQERAKGYTPDESLAAAKQYLGTTPPIKIDDRQTDTFASPREAAARLHELRRVEATEALKARAAAAHFEIKDLNAGKSPEQLEAEFTELAPDWVRNAPDAREARELWKASLKAAGDEVSVKQIEAYEDSFEEASRREKAEQAEVAAQEPAAPQPQLQPDLEAERQRLATREQELAAATQLTAREVVLGDQARQSVQAIGAKYGNIKTWADLEMLRVTQPERHAELFKDMAALGGQMQQLQQIGAVRQAIQHQHRTETAAAQKQAWDKYAREQDEAFIRAHPDGNDPEVQRAAMKYVCETYGLTEQQAQVEWSTNPNLRNAGTQAMILTATKARMAKDGLESKRAVAEAPPVMVPGNRNGGGAFVAPDEMGRLERMASDESLPLRQRVAAGAQWAAARRARGDNF